MTQSAIVPPSNHGLYYGGKWHAPAVAKNIDVHSPATGERLANIADASAADIDPVVAAARKGYELWRDVRPLERAKILRQIASVIRANLEDLAQLDAIDCGNPVDNLRSDVEMSAAAFDFFGGLVTEMKGSSVPVGPDARFRISDGTISAFLAV